MGRDSGVKEELFAATFLYCGLVVATPLYWRLPRPPLFSKYTTLKRVVAIFKELSKPLSMRPTKHAQCGSLKMTVRDSQNAMRIHILMCNFKWKLMHGFRKTHGFCAAEICSTVAVTTSK
jgi:hypothetical protein